MAESDRPQNLVGDIPPLWNFRIVPHEPEDTDPEVEEGNIRLPPVKVTPMSPVGLEQSWLFDKALGHHRVLGTLREFKEGETVPSPLHPLRHPFLRELVGKAMLKLLGLRGKVSRCRDHSTRQFLREGILFLQKKLGKLHDRIR